MRILGINDHHNSAASLMVDGRLICAIQEERLARVKNHAGMPVQAIEALLGYAGLAIEDCDVISFSGTDQAPLERGDFRRRLEMLRNIVQADPVDALRGRPGPPPGEALWLRFRDRVRRRMPRFLRRRSAGKWQRARIAQLHEVFPNSRPVPTRFIDHHRCHAATARFGAPHAPGPRLIFTNDGLGDFKCGSVTRVNPDGTEDLLDSIADRHSIGQLWAWLTLMMGFVPLEHEYKLMGMAPYADPRRAERLALELADLFSFEGGQYRRKGAEPGCGFYDRELLRSLHDLTRFQRFDDVCAGIQLFTERALSRWVQFWVDRTGIRNVCLSGGTFMNVKAGLAIMKLPRVETLFVFPSCGDESNAIGACYETHYRELGKAPEPLANFFLGISWAGAEIRSAIEGLGGVDVERCDDVEDRVASLLADGHVVARFKGREEFGARALGNRSILAHPGDPSVVAEINDMIKKRDFWMPFACSVLEEDRGKYLDDPGKIDGRYMIMAFEGGQAVDEIRAGIHPRDKTARPQIVNREQAPSYHRLISAFRRRTGIGAILNTSFNLHGEPLVHSPADALSVLQRSGLRYLAMGNYLLAKR